jgi:glyoxylase-like metal-dependent hydrolase (beta-lactamase superfamily II)
MAVTMLPEYEVFAIRYAAHQRNRNHNFIAHDPHDGPMPMDYFVWLVRGAGRTFLVDTGFNAEAARQRGREHLRCPIGALEALGVRADQVSDVIITHLHYDHAGNVELLPNARLHLQEREMHYAVGRYMAYQPLRQAYSVPDVQHLVGRVHAGQVRFHDGDATIAPGIQLALIGGHTMGLQSVRVHTARGWVVLASDASHYYENMETDSPFPLVHDVGAMLEGYRKLQALAESPDHLVPGHDPLVMARYPRLGKHDVVCLHAAPTNVGGKAGGVSSIATSCPHCGR